MQHACSFPISQSGGCNIMYKIIQLQTLDLIFGLNCEHGMVNFSPHLQLSSYGDPAPTVDTMCSCRPSTTRFHTVCFLRCISSYHGCALIYSIFFCSACFSMFQCQQIRRSMLKYVNYSQPSIIRGSVGPVLQILPCTQRSKFTYVF